MCRITLQDLKERPINKEVDDLLKRTDELCEWNKSVKRHRMDNGDIRYQVFDMTHDGNDPKDNEYMLDVARLYYRENVYTDEEWEKYFIPAINEMIEYNNSFVRWMPGYIIKNKATGKCAIVEYDYALGFGHICSRCRDFTSLSVCDIGEDGEVRGSWAWAHYENYELVDKNHTEENIAKVRVYHTGNNHTPPYYLSREMSNLFYGQDSTEAPQRKRNV